MQLTSKDDDTSLRAAGVEALLARCRDAGGVGNGVGRSAGLETAGIDYAAVMSSLARFICAVAAPTSLGSNV